MKYKEFIKKINEQPTLDFSYGSPSMETMPSASTPAGHSIKPKKDAKLKKFDNPLAGKGFPYN